MPKDEMEFTHLNSAGQLRMVDVSEKDVTSREARAEARIRLDPRTLRRIEDQEIPKGNVYEAARLAGILAAKKTWDLIPLCHPIRITGIEIGFSPDFEESVITINARVKTQDRTGIEMEALVAVTHAALTIYDMCKAVDREMEIHGIRLTFKTGGRSGTYERT
jgi:cyclic pyranopterin phosphate synthase